MFFCFVFSKRTAQRQQLVTIKKGILCPLHVHKDGLTGTWNDWNIVLFSGCYFAIFEITMLVNDLVTAAGGNPTLRDCSSANVI